MPVPNIADDADPDLGKFWLFDRERAVGKGGSVDGSLNATAEAATNEESAENKSTGREYQNEEGDEELVTGVG